jgi:hypothetical protein
LLPDDYVLMDVMLPDRLIARLDEPLEEPLTAIGNRWLAGSRSAALRVPSVLMAKAWNILLNPRHPDAEAAHVTAIEPFVFDPRLWQPLGSE